MQEHLGSGLEDLTRIFGKAHNLHKLNKIVIRFDLLGPTMWFITSEYIYIYFYKSSKFNSIILSFLIQLYEVTILSF